MNNVKKYKGVAVPMVTPLTSECELDEPAVRRLIDYIIRGGADGIFVLGTTGERASIPLPMRRRLIELTVEHTNRRALVYAGVGDDCVAHSVAAAAECVKLGVDAVVAHLPCYFVLQPEDMFRYYMELIERIEGPLVLYNIPSTTHMSIPVEVLARLSEHPRIVGFKDSENSPGRLEEVTSRLVGRDDFSLFMGASVLSARALSLGMDGVVPGSGNLEPRAWRDLCDAARRGDRQGAERIQSRLDGLLRVFQRDRTLGQFLAALKAAMNMKGLCGPAMMPPLRSLSSEEVERLRRDLSELGWFDPCPVETSDSAG